MIIRIDVNDNDFSERVFNILNDSVNGLGFISDDYFNKKMKEVIGKNDEKSLKAYKDYSIARDEIRHFLAYGEESKKEYNKDLVIKYLKLGVLYLIEDAFSKEDYKYLEEQIEITLPKSMKCEWENGEVIYYIPNTYSDNKFLLF